MGLYGWRLLSLIGAALLGGYALAAAFGIFLGGVLPTSRGDAAMAGTLLSFAAYAGAIIWAFTIRKPAKVWFVLLLVSAILAAAGMAFAGQTP